MINGFPEETADLNADELALVPGFVASLSKRIGKEKSVRASDITSIYAQKFNEAIDGARVRKIINYIRVRRLVPNLVGTAKGYHVEADPQEIKTYVEGLIQRANAILSVANSYSETTEKLYKIQEHNKTLTIFK